MKTLRKPYKPLEISYDRFSAHVRMWIRAVQQNEDPAFHNDVANYIRNFIFDVGQRSTGYVSEEALKLKPKFRCKEHFHSRLGIGRLIVKGIAEGRYDFDDQTIRRLYAIIFSACRVHNTTSEENNRLAVIQNDPATKDLSWKKQYRIAGIKLIYTGPVYIWEGTRYIGWTVGDMAKLLGVSVYRFQKHISPNALL